MNVKTSTQFKKHKKYRWIALFIKLALSPILALAFARLTPVIFPKSSQTLGSTLATLVTLMIYYGIIFFLNRWRNFKTDNDLYKSVTIYIVVIVFLITIESLTSGTLQNLLYKACHLPYEGESLTILTATNKLAYLGFGFLIQFAFGYVTGIILFLLFKYVLSKKQVLEKI